MAVLTTADAIALGLLAERSWSAYELASQMAIPNLAGALWPVSERTCYRLPKRLVEAGLATANEPADGGPTRYEITGSGRAALAALRPDDSPVLTFRSSQLALLYATAGGPIDHSVTLLRHIQDSLVVLTELSAATYRQRAADGPDLPGRAHISALLGRYISEAAMHAYQWAETAARELRELDDGDRVEFARRAWEDVADTLETLLTNLRPATLETTG